MNCTSTLSRFAMEVLLLILVLIQCSLAQEVTLRSGIERSALLDLRSSLGLRGRDWGIKKDPCLFWKGVACRDGRVTGINVSGLRRTRAGKTNPQFAVDALANFTVLVSFNASGFGLPGPIPDWFGLRLKALKVLDLRSSSVKGSIPASLGNLGSLNSLFLSNNSLTGIIPSTLGLLSELSILEFSKNSLTGSIPSAFASLANLTKLDLASNFLSGLIPAELGTLSKLQHLDLSDNSLTAKVPAQLGNLSQLIELNLSLNSLSGSLPAELRGLSNLQKMLVRNNKLDGPLPEGLFSSLGNISFVDLSSNYFQGVVPDEIRSIAALNKNCLRTVPNQHSLDDCRLFYAESGLNFDDFGASGPTDSPLPQPDSKSSARLIYILVGIFGGLGFIVVLVLVLLLFLRTCDKSTGNQRGSANAGPVPEGDFPPLPKDSINLSGLGEAYTYEQMLVFTGRFNEDNLIKHGHSGDLFQGFLEGGSPVVVKRVDLRSFKKETYMLELELLGRVSHERLVPLLGHCLEHENEKLLVYKYMPNGDLANSLHRVSSSEDEDDNLQSLDWITRLKIATGAAESLTFLHHECTPPLVHRDVQASSILLDDKFEVRLGSLSDVHAQEGDPHQNVLTRLLRRSQTSKQGMPGSSSATCAYDVYCFGKVLLELVTGKLGISKSDDDSTKEWLEHTLPCISIYDKELVTKIVDPSLIVDEDLLEEVWAMAIVAKSCLNPKPLKRPLIKYVLKALENPLKVVREDNLSSERLRTTSSRGSWSAAFFGSWRHSSSESATIPGHPAREGISGLKHSGTVNSHGSGGNELSSSQKRHSSEIFPEPVEMQDLERQDEH